MAKMLSSKMRHSSKMPIFQIQHLHLRNVTEIERIDAMIIETAVRDLRETIDSREIDLRKTIDSREIDLRETIDSREINLRETIDSREKDSKEETAHSETETIKKVMEIREIIREKTQVITL